MKKILFLSLLASLFLSSWSNIAEKTDWELLKLKGKVKSLKETSYQAIIGTQGVEKGIYKDSIYTLFNERGYRIEEKQYNSDREVCSGQTYIRNTKNDLIEVIQYETYTTYKFLFKRNKENLVSEISSFDEQGDTINTQTYSYDNQGKLLKLSSYENGTLFSSTTYAYDENDNLKEVLEDYSSSELGSKKIVLKYDEENNIIEAKTTWFIDDGDFIIHYKYQYDDKGEVSVEYAYSTLDDDWAKMEYVYDYDSRNNWIIRYKYEDDTLKFITEREIEYFD